MRRSRWASAVAAAIAVLVLGAQAASESGDHGQRTTQQRTAASGLPLLRSSAAVAHREASPRSPLGRRGADVGRLPRQRPEGPALKPDSRGAFFGASGEAARRLSPVRTGRQVALIFDDGPGPQTTDVLRELRRAGARATFFVVGREAARQPERVRALRGAGMELGSHSWSHVPMSGLDARAQRREVEHTAAELARIAGVRPRLFRPPAVAWDAATARTVSGSGSLGVLHTIETNDWRLPGRAAITAAAEQAGPGDIVALHDAGGDRSQTLAAIRPIVDALRRRGLACVTVSELLGQPPPGASRHGFAELERRLAEAPD